VSDLYTKGQLTKLFSSLEQIINDKSIINCNLLKSKLIHELDTWRITECKSGKQKALIKRKIQSLIKLEKLKVINNEITLLD
jgi:hypothetical protein